MTLTFSEKMTCQFVFPFHYQPENEHRNIRLPRFPRLSQHPEVASLAVRLLFPAALIPTLI